MKFAMPMDRRACHHAAVPALAIRLSEPVSRVLEADGRRYLVPAKDRVSVTGWGVDHASETLLAKEERPPR
jgi:hypothetical protein